MQSSIRKITERNINDCVNTNILLLNGLITLLDFSFFVDATHDLRHILNNAGCVLLLSVDVDRFLSRLNHTLAYTSSDLIHIVIVSYLKHTKLATLFILIHVGKVALMTSFDIIKSPLTLFINATEHTYRLSFNSGKYMNN